MFKQNQHITNTQILRKPAFVPAVIQEPMTASKDAGLLGLTNTLRPKAAHNDWANSGLQCIHRQMMVVQVGQERGNRHLSNVLQLNILQRNNKSLSAFNVEVGSKFKKIYVARASNCMSAVYAGLGSLYGHDYSEDLRKRVYAAAQKADKDTRQNTNTINRLMNMVKADGKAGEKHTLKYTPNGKWNPSPEATVMGMTSNTAGWYMFGFSLHNGYHSVMLAVDKTDPNDPRLYWADQLKSGLQDVTNNLETYMLGFKPRYGYHHAYIWQLIPAPDTRVDTGETIKIRRGA